MRSKSVFQRRVIWSQIKVIFAAPCVVYGQVVVLKGLTHPHKWLCYRSKWELFGDGPCKTIMKTAVHDLDYWDLCGDGPWTTIIEPAVSAIWRCPSPTSCSCQVSQCVSIPTKFLWNWSDLLLYLMIINSPCESLDDISKLKWTFKKLSPMNFLNERFSE